MKTRTKIWLWILGSMVVVPPFLAGCLAFFLMIVPIEHRQILHQTVSNDKYTLRVYSLVSGFDPPVNVIVTIADLDTYAKQETTLVRIQGFPGFTVRDLAFLSSEKIKFDIAKDSLVFATCDVSLTSFDWRFQNRPLTLEVVEPEP